MTTYHANAARLQEAMRQRREELGRSQREVAERGGLSRIAIVRYEKGEISEDIRPSTLREIDQGLDWPEDEASRILGLPVEPQQDPEIDHSAGSAVDLQTLTKYVHAVATMQQTMREEIAQIPPDVSEAMQEVTIVQTNLLLDLTEALSTRQA